jgi:hypothetical protein
MGKHGSSQKLKESWASDFIVVPREAMEKAGQTGSGLINMNNLAGLGM